MKITSMLSLLGAGLLVYGAAGAAGPQIRDGQLVLPGPVVFETGSDKLRPESAAVLSQVKEFMDEKSYVTLLRIEAHSDNAGSPAAAQALTERRAFAVGRYLVQAGVACGRLLPVGFGQNKPVADNATPEGKAQNRRVSFLPAALRGRPIGGMPVDGGGKVAGDLCK